uniref:CLLAC-motif containing domain-containing protein n=1 Tax=Marmota marmota marmota TaxID=9994 RepID=A0A8C5YVA5_MARMA
LILSNQDLSLCLFISFSIQLPRNPYCPNEGMHCGCRLHNVPLQTPVTAKPCSLWKTFLVCLLACLIAAAIVILVLYFGHFGNPTSYPTIVINADGKPSQITCFPGTTPPLTSSPLPGSQSTSSSTPVTRVDPACCFCELTQIPALRPAGRRTKQAFDVLRFLATAQNTHRKRLWGFHNPSYLPFRCSRQ